MIISNDLLSILCCPETKQSLSPADETLIEILNQKIVKGELRTRGGESVTRNLDGGLVRDDQRYLYAVRDGIPIMLIGEAIPLAGIL